MKIKYDPVNHGDFSFEWELHKKCKEWWYATGILFDKDKNMYSYQYTLLHMNLGCFTGKVAMIALTDYKNKRHYYLQTLADRKNKVVVTKDEASIGELVKAKKEDKGIHMVLNHKNFSMDILADYGKGAIWHCEEGKLQMGIVGEKETTLYYSWTNMPTKAKLILNGEEIELIGKSWFDKQGGTYSITNTKTNWEWFSLRFFDDTEAMLFTFPHNNPPYYDGTYIFSDGSYERLNDYRVERLKITEHKGLKWSAGWKIMIKGKEYLVEPLQEGHMNFAYFEELCDIKDEEGKVVGYAFAELLPGILNTGLGSGENKLSMSNLFKRVEF